MPGASISAVSHPGIAARMGSGISNTIAAGMDVGFHLVAMPRVANPGMSGVHLVAMPRITNPGMSGVRRGMGCAFFGQLIPISHRMTFLKA